MFLELFSHLNETNIPWGFIEVLYQQPNTSQERSLCASPSPCRNIKYSITSPKLPYTNVIPLNNLRICEIQTNSASHLDKVSCEILQIWISLSYISGMFWEYSGLEKSALRAFPSEQASF